MKPARSKERSILVIDSDISIRFVLKKLLGRYTGSRIFTSGDGVQGLGYAMILIPDIVIIDATLPRYSGLELVKYLTTNKKFKDTQIILLHETRETFKDTKGEYHQLEKDVDTFPENLLDFILSFLSEKEKIKRDSFFSNVTNFIARRVISYSNIASIFIERETTANFIVRLYERLIFILNQLVTSFYLFIFFIIVGKIEQEEIIDEEREALRKFRVRMYPAIGFAMAIIILLIAQLVLVLISTISVALYGAKYALAASYTWDGGGTDGTCGGNAGDGNKWSCATNWSSDIVPASADTVTFNDTSTKNATIDASFAGTVTNLTVDPGYSETITMARSLTISGTFSQSDGVFTASNQSFTTAVFTLATGGIFTASSGVTAVSATFTITGGTFNHNSGTMTFDGAGATISCNNVTFNLVTFSAASNIKTISSNCTLPLGNNPSFSRPLINNGTLSGTGTLTIGVSTSTLVMNTGSSLSSFSAISTAGALTVAGATLNLSGYTSFAAVGNVGLSSGSLTLPNAGADLNADLIISGGTFTAPSGTMTLAVALSISGSPTFNANGGIITFDGSTATLSCNNVTFNAVILSPVSGVKTVNSNCSLPLGNNPTIGNSVIINGTLNGTGTLTHTAGTLTQNTGSSVSGFSGLVASGFTISGATVNLGSYSPVTINGAFLLSSGTFTAPTGTMTAVSTFTISSGATFNHNSGTLTFTGTTAVITCNSSTFNSIIFNNTGLKTIASDCNFPIGNNPTIANSVTLNGTLSGTGTLTLTTGTFTYQNAASLSGFGGLISNAAFTIGVSSGGTANTSLNLGTYTTVDINGAFVLNTPTVTFTTTFTAPTGTMTLGAGVTFNSSTTFNANGGTFSIDGATSATITCNNAVFNSVTIDTSSTKTIAANCSLPLGNNPTISGTSSLNVNGTLSGTGTLTKSGAGSGFVMNASTSTLSGFTALDFQIFTVQNSSSVNLSTYSSFVVAGAVSISSGSLTMPTAGADLNGGLTISGGTFTSSSGTMTLVGSISITGSPTFNANGGTISMDGIVNASYECNNVTFNLITIPANGSPTTTNTRTIGSDCNFPLGNNPIVNAATFLSGTLSGTGTLTVNSSRSSGILTMNAGAALSGFTGLEMTDSNSAFNINGATVDLSGYTTVKMLDTGFTMTSGTFTAPPVMNIGRAFTYIAGTFNHNNGKVVFDGPTVSQVNSGCPNVTSCTPIFYNMEVNKDTTALSSSLLTTHLRLANTLTVTRGLLTQGALNVRIDGSTAISVAVNGTYTNTSTGNLTLAGSVSNAGVITIQGNGTTCAQAIVVSITSTSSGVQRAWSGTGTFNINDVSVQDQGGTAGISAKSSTDVSGNGANWVFMGCSNTAPSSPSSLAQLKVDNTAITTGTMILENSVKFTANATDPNNPDYLYLCVEIKPIGTAFTNVNTSCGGQVSYIGVLIAMENTISGIADEFYHWQARTRDITGTYSAWVSYGGNAESATDFSIDATGATGGIVYDGSTVGVDITYNDGSLSTLAANWGSFNFGPSGIGGYEYSIGISAGDNSIKNWTSNGTGTSVSVSSLNLKTSVLYYFNVRATDGVGNVSVFSSNGQYVAPGLSFSLSANTITFDVLNNSNSFSDTKTTTLTTSVNSAHGYVIRAYKTGLLRHSAGVITIPDFSAGSYSSPAAWGGSDYGFGYTSSDTSIQGVNIFSPATCLGGGSPPCYAPFSSTAPGDIVADHTSAVSGTPITNQAFTLTYKLKVSAIQAAGGYNTTLIYSIIPQY